MSRAKPGRGTVLTALLLAAAFLAGSATYLAVKDSFTAPAVPDPQEEKPYLLIPPQTTTPTAPPAVEIVDATVPDPEPQPEEVVVAVQPDTPSVEATAPRDDGDGSVPVSVSGDTPVKQLYVKPVEGPISKAHSGGELVYSHTDRKSTRLNSSH